MLKHSITICAAIFIFTLPQSSFAQENDQTDTASATGTGSITTGSGSTASGATASGSTNGSSSLSLESIQQQAAKKQWEARLARSKNFREDYKKSLKTIEAMRIQKKNNLAKRLEHRSECRKLLRRASKFTKLETAETCFRAELTLNLERLRKERTYIEELPGISDDVRWLTITRIDLLTDAMSVIINAIDSQVYESTDELEEAKQSLYINYRRPKWLMTTRVQADKLITWIGSIVDRIGMVAEQDDISPEMSEALVNSVNCLTEAEIVLKSVLKTSELEQAKLELKAAHTQMRECITMIRSSKNLVKEEEPEPVAVEEEIPAAPEQIINRRLRRRLGENYTINAGNNTNLKGAAPDAEDVEVTVEVEAETEEVDPNCDLSKVSRRLRKILENSACRIK